jgi:hypothetical protein
MTAHLRTVAAVVVVLGLAITATATCAEPVQMNQVLASQIRHLQLRISAGRIIATTEDLIRAAAGRQSSVERQESLTVQYSGALVTLHYELGLPNMTLTYEIRDARDVTIRRIPRGDAKLASIEVAQPGEGPIRLRIERDGKVSETTHPSLWHALLSQSPESRKELAEIIEIIRPTWKLGPTASTLEAGLLRKDYAPPPFDRQQIAQWIDELGSDRFAVRKAAERNLRGLGQSVLPLLRQAEGQKLDAEQRFRLRSIMHGMTDDEQEDTVDRLAAQMSIDPYTWLTLLGRDDEKLRGVAVERLEKLLNAPVAFDASNPTESIEKVKAQIDRTMSGR